MSTVIFEAIVFVLNLIILLLVLKRKRRAVDFSFAGIVLGIMIWIATVAMFPYFTDKKILILIAQLAYIGPLLVAVSVVFFSYSFPVKTKQFTVFKRLIASVGGALALIIIFIPNFVLEDIGNEDYELVTGPGLNLLFFIIISFLIWCLFNLIVKYRKLSGVYKLQLRYLYIGLFFSALIGAFTNALLPLFDVYRLVFFGPSATIILVLFIYYAITRHKLLDIRLIVLRTVSYSILIIIISTIVVLLAFLLPRLVTDTFIQTVIAILVAVILVTSLEPLKRALGKITDKLFFQAKIDYLELQRNLGETINREIDLKKLVTAINQKLVLGLKIQKARILLSGEKDGLYQTITDMGENLSINKASKLAEYLSESKRIVVLESLERKIEDTQDDGERKKLEESKAKLDRLDVAVAAPIVSDKKLAAILVLGIKKSGDTYSQDDLNLLEVLGPQLASAIEKSKLYDKVRRFNVKLQKEITIATEGLRNANEKLQDQNRFLTALQVVTSLVTRSLDFQKVTQDIVNSIVTKLGYRGGILLFYTKDKKKLYPQAISRVHFTKQIEKILPLQMEQYTVNLNRDDTLAVETVQSGNTTRSEHLADFIAPPVPTMAVNAIQKLVGAHSFIGIPITSENEIVGCLVYLAEEQLDELKERDLNMMHALADQTGIIYRNLELVDQIKKTNEDLEEANEHLKQLDQAKSEFVSIASHQLRTPMTGIMGYLSMMTSGDFGKVPKSQKGILENLLDASQRMIQLINLFLDVSKIESGKLILDRRPHQVEELITKAIDSLSKQARDKKLKLIFKKPKTKLPELQIDEKIYDVISNLIDNAIKYTGKGGITVSAEKTDGNVKVVVKDTGRGIPPEEAKQLFNKFVRGYGIAQVNPDGSGLGLYVARRLTEGHGGKIWVESEGKDKGSSFIFTLPIHPPTVTDDAT